MVFQLKDPKFVLVEKENNGVEKINKKKKEGREWNIKGSLNAGFNSSVEASEGIIAVGVELALLVNVVFVVFLAYGVDPE